MESFAHVKSKNGSWESFETKDATHGELADLSGQLDTDAVWLVRRDPESSTRVAPSQAGLYRIPVGYFEFSSPGDEMCYVISGAATVVVEESETVHLEKGDMVFWPRGTKTKWTVSEEFTQFFTMIG